MRYLVFFLIVMLLCSANVVSDPRTEALCKKIFSSGEAFEKVTNAILVKDGSNLFLGLCIATNDFNRDIYGYAGRINLFLALDQKGTIKGISTLDQSETIFPAIDYLEKNLEKEYVGKSIYDKITIGKDIDSVTGATITVSGALNTIQFAGSKALETYNTDSSATALPAATTVVVTEEAFATLEPEITPEIVVTPEPEITPDPTVKPHQERSLFGMHPGVLVVMFIYLGAMIAFFKANKKIRLVMSIVVVVVLGFLQKNIISINDIYALFLGKLQALQSHQPHFTLLVVAILSGLILGRIYCGYLCAFGVLTELLSECVPKDLRKKINRLKLLKTLYPLRYLRYILLFAVFALISNKGARYILYVEPFYTTFAMTGSALIIGVAACFILLSTIIPRAYCRYFCPVGAFFSIIAIIPNTINRYLIMPYDECEICKICEKSCPTGAISPDGLFRDRCILCTQCRENSHITSLCTHHLLLAKKENKEKKEAN